MYERRRNLVRRNDGRLVNVARARGQLLVCADNCCCGRTEDGIAPVPKLLYNAEWERRRLRNFVHLTLGGCLGPCALANVTLLIFEGRLLWFREINSEALVLALFDYVEALLEDDCAPLPEPLAALQFTASTWQPRPDGLPVDDLRPRKPRGGRAQAATPAPPCDAGEEAGAALIAGARAPEELPRRNGELVFEAPWQGRAFGMAMALSEHSLFPWEEFRQRLIAEIGAADARGDPSQYYERWLAAFEALLAERGAVTREELDERTYQFEFGERDEVF